MALLPNYPQRKVILLNWQIKSKENMQTATQKDKEVKIWERSKKDVNERIVYQRYRRGEIKATFDEMIEA